MPSAVEIEPEWIAWVIVKRMPCTSAVPPVLKPTRFSSPCAPKCMIVSYLPTTGAPVRCAIGTTSAV